MTEKEFIQKYGEEFADELVEIVNGNPLILTGTGHVMVKPAKMYLQLYREISKFITNDCKATQQLFSDIHNYFNTNKDIVAQLPNTEQVFRYYMSISKKHSHLLNLQEWGETISTKGIAGLNNSLQKNYAPCTTTRKRCKKNTGDRENHKRPKSSNARFFQQAAEQTEQDMLDQIWQEICAKKTLIITGAGISVDAGIAPFTGNGGLYEGKNGEAVKKAWTVDKNGKPNLKLFYETNKSLYLNIYDPTLTHNVISELLKQHDNINLATMNVDYLHETAAVTENSNCSPTINNMIPIHIHGKIWGDHQCSSNSCGNTTAFFDVKNQLKASTEIPTCKCGFPLIPPVVFYGTDPKAKDLEEMTELLTKCKHIIVIGSSLTVNPAAQLIAVAVNNGATLTIINRNITGIENDGIIATHRIYDINEFAEYMDIMLNDDNVTFNPNTLTKI